MSDYAQKSSYQGLAAAPRPAPELARIAARLEDAVNTFETQLGRIINCTDRLIGSRPQDCGSAKLATVPSSLVNRLEEVANRLDTINGLMTTEVSRLEGVV